MPVTGDRSPGANCGRESPPSALSWRSAWTARSLTPIRCSCTGGWTSEPPRLSPAAAGGIAHHVMDIWDVTEPASVAAYQALARAAIDGILHVARFRCWLVAQVCTFGQFLKNLSFPGRIRHPSRTRGRTGRRSAPARCTHRLASSDPAAAARILPSNGRRIVRALEVISLTGETFTATLPEPGAVLLPDPGRSGHGHLGPGRAHRHFESTGWPRLGWSRKSRA